MEAAFEAEVEQLRERIAALEEERRISLRAAEDANRQNAATAQALRESEERFSVLTQNLHCAVALVDEGGAFRFVNNVFLRSFEIPEGGAILDEGGAFRFVNNVFLR